MDNAIWWMTLEVTWRKHLLLTCLPPPRAGRRQRRPTSGPCLAPASASLAQPGFPCPARLGKKQNTFHAIFPEFCTSVPETGTMHSALSAASGPHAQGAAPANLLWTSSSVWTFVVYMVDICETYVAYICGHTNPTYCYMSWTNAQGNLHILQHMSNIHSQSWHMSTFAYKCLDISDSVWFDKLSIHTVLADLLQNWSFHSLPERVLCFKS